MQIGDQVRIRPAGSSLFTIESIDGEHAVIEAAGNAPGKYPFQVKLADLLRDNS